MKRLLLLVVGSALAFFMGMAPAQADNGPHISLAVTGPTTGVVIAQAGAGKCAGCHRAHTAQASYLLVQEQPALCYTCHDGTAAGTNPKDGINAWTGGALRGGGFDNAMIGSHTATKDVVQSGTRLSGANQLIPVISAEATTSKHDINVAGTLWGNGAIGSGAGTAVTLECGSCHDPHGNGNYRILRSVPVDSGAAAPGVTIPDATTKVYTTTNYWLAGDPNSPIDPTGTAFTGTQSTPTTTDGYIQNVAAWCTTCHTRYLAPTQSYKTASGDPIFMYRHRSDANYKAGAANCITCHVAHGSNATMTGSSATQVKMPDGTASADSRLLRVDNRGTCLMCHNV